MTYEESMRFIRSLDKFGSRPGLDRIRRLFDFVPDTLDQPFIHVAGTNGKGSVCAMLACVLREAGYTVGQFTSPYITTYREHIQIDGQPVFEEDFAEAVSYLAPKVQELSAEGVIITEFEFLTVLAFTIFKRQKCDFVICEAGMGGLLDATNVIKNPLCAVITRVDLDHTAFLGGTIGEIAFQKAGIIKENSAAVTAVQPEEAAAVIKAKATEKNNILFRASDVDMSVTQTTRDGTVFFYRGREMLLPLIGRHQIDNLRCALAALDALEVKYGMTLSAEVIRRGLGRVRQPARFEKLRDDPTVILDGAHNPNGMRAFARTVRELYPEGDKTLIIGMLADKDSAALENLRGLFTRAITADIDNPRALSAEALAQRLGGICESVEAVGDPGAAYEKALSYGDDVFICGSLYLAREIRPIILGE
ncbi:MAG: bifunctional folylpolyglutamate synthase/dihydrofolate synthase [Ruminococcus sp.]|nr:bifunctional folylpolyglutamate synthase/dihydrofolate synthase [Ruminococcus sp.]